MLAVQTNIAPPLQADTILVLGDSISAAYGIQREQGWVALLASRLEKLGNTHRVVNASISGETTAGGLARLEQLLNAHSPNIVILELGGNDGLRGYPIDSIHQNMSRMIKIALNTNTRVLVLGMRIPPNYGARYTNAFYNIYQSLAQTHDISHIPFFLEGIGNQPALMQADGVHPTNQAQTLLLENVWPPLQKLLEQYSPERIL